MNSNGIKVLVVQTGKIGDLVCTTPLFRTLSKFTGGPVDLVAGAFAADLLAGNDAIGKIFPRSVKAGMLRKEGYSHVFLLMPSAEILVQAFLARIPNRYGTRHKVMNLRDRLASWLLTKSLWYEYATPIQDHYLKFASAIGTVNKLQKREIFFGTKEKEHVRQLLSDLDPARRLIGISATGGKNFKKWGKQNFIALVDLLHDRGFQVVGVGSEQDREELAAVGQGLRSPNLFLNLGGKLTLNQLAALCAQLTCLIAADTGPLYVADAAGVPVVDLMGPCSSKGQKPESPRAIIVGECPNLSHPKCYMMNCPNSLAPEYARCMREITVEQVWRAFLSLKL